jgi:putative membrane protein
LSRRGKAKTFKTKEVNALKKMKKALVAMTLLIGVMMTGATIATMQENRNQNQNGNANGNRNNMNSNRMNANRMNSNTGGNMNANMGGNMNAGGNMNSNMTMSSNMGGAMTVSDTEFATMAAQGSTAEIQMSQLAEQKATSKDVQKFARQMIKDHTKSNNNLMKVAAKKQMTLPTTPSADQMQMMSQLQASSGAEFDRLYIQLAGVQAHQMMLGLYQSEISNGTDADIKSFARKTLPTVQKHLRMAQEMANEGMTGGNMNMGGGNMNGNMNTNNNRNRNNSNRGNTNNSNR